MDIKIWLMYAGPQYNYIIIITFEFSTQKLAKTSIFDQKKSFSGTFLKK